MDVKHHVYLLYSAGGVLKGPDSRCWRDTQKTGLPLLAGYLKDRTLCLLAGYLKDRTLAGGGILKGPDAVLAGGILKGPNSRCWRGTYRTGLPLPMEYFKDQSPAAGGILNLKDRTPAAGKILQGQNSRCRRNTSRTGLPLQAKCLQDRTQRAKFLKERTSFAGRVRKSKASEARSLGIV